MMRKSAVTILAIGLFMFLPSQFLSAVRADSIAITSATSDTTGEIVGSGTYTIDAGHTVKAVTMYIWDEAGQNILKSVSADWDTNKLTWKGIAIGLTSGTTYQVGASITVDDGMFGQIIPAPTKLKVKCK